MAAYSADNELKERIRELERLNALLKREGDMLARHEQQLDMTRRLIDVRLALIEYAPLHSLDDLLTKALDEVSELLDSPIGFYHFVSEDQKTLTLQQWSSRTLNEFCRTEAKGIHYGIDKAGVWVDCVYEKKPVIHNDYASLAHKKGMPEGHAEVVRELVVPVMRKDKVVAILGVGNKPAEYGQTDIDIVSYFADVTWEIVRQKRANEALQNEKQLSEQYINSLPGLFYVFDEKEKLIRWNNSWNTITGYSDEEIAQRQVTDFFKEQEKAIIKDRISRAFNDGFADVEAELVTKDKRRISFYFTGHLKNINGKNYIIGLGIDITDRKEAEAKIRKQEKTESIIQMAGTVCHEFSQPLQIINGCAEILATQIPETDKKFDKLKKIQDQVERMAGLTKKLREITRYQVKAYGGETTIIDLDDSAERRQHKRYKPVKGTVVNSQPVAFADGRLIDISMSGLSFYCRNDDNQNDEHLQLSIGIPGEDFHLDNIQCSVIAISKIAGGNSTLLNVYKEYRVKFDGTDDRRTRQIGYFIDHYAIQENPLG